MSKRQRVDSSSDSESEMHLSFNREEDFFKGPTTHKIGFFKIRLYFDNEKFMWVICLVKNLSTSDVNGQKPSFIVFPASEITSLASNLRNIVRQLRLSSLGSKEDRLLYADEPEAYKKDSFWNKPFCVKTSGEKLVLRPYKDPSGGCSVKMLKPKTSANYRDWQGTSVSWGVQDSLEFANLLERFQKFIKIADEEFLKVLNEKKSEGTLERPSPTKSDLDQIDDITPIAAKTGALGDISTIDECEIALEKTLGECDNALEQLQEDNKENK